MKKLGPIVFILGVIGLFALNEFDKKMTAKHKTKEYRELILQKDVKELRTCGSGTTLIQTTNGLVYVVVSNTDDVMTLMSPDGTVVSKPTASVASNLQAILGNGSLYGEYDHVAKKFFSAMSSNALARAAASQ